VTLDPVEQLRELFRGRSVTAAFLVVGVVPEFVGIVLIGFPDFVPGAIRLSGWLRRNARHVADGFRRIFRRPRRGVVVQVGAAGGVALGGSVSAEGEYERDDP
jgi:hypothetical protein